jgi:hypothetical protein
MRSAANKTHLRHYETFSELWHFRANQKVRKMLLRSEHWEFRDAAEQVSVRDSGQHNAKTEPRNLIERTLDHQDEGFRTFEPEFGFSKLNFSNCYFVPLWGLAVLLGFSVQPGNDEQVRPEHGVN